MISTFTSPSLLGKSLRALVSREMAFAPVDEEEEEEEEEDRDIEETDDGAPAFC